MGHKFKVGDVIVRIKSGHDEKTVTGVQEKAAHEYQLSDGTYWWSQNSIENHYELKALLESPLYKALS